MPKRTPKTNRAPDTAVVLSDQRYRRLLHDVKALLEQESAGARGLPGVAAARRRAPFEMSLGDGVASR